MNKEKLSNRAHPKMLLVIGLTSLTCLWLGLSSSVWWINKYHQGNTNVKFLDLAIPTRWTAYQTSKGDFYITKAKQVMIEGDYPKSLNYLKIGVQKSPTNSEGCILLADFYVAQQRPDLVKNLIISNLNILFKTPEHLVKAVSFLFLMQEDKAILSHTLPLLGSSSGLSLHYRRLLAGYAATAAFNLGNYTQAEQIIHSHLGLNSTEAIALLARIEWERGYHDLALLRLRDGIDGRADAASLRTLQGSYYRASNRISEWESSLVERIVADPLSFEARIEYLHMHHQRGNRERETSEVEVYLEEFGANQHAVLMLADFAANTGQPPIAIRAHQLVAERGDASGAVSLMIAEAQIKAGEFQAALDLLASYVQRHPEWSAQYAPIFNGLQAVAYCGLGKNDEARLRLDTLFAQENLRADNLVVISHRLSALGAKDLARSTLNRAVHADPLNEVALNSLIEEELDLGGSESLPSHLQQFLTMRKPSRTIAARAYLTLGSDEHLFLPTQAKLLPALAAVLAASRN